VRQYVEGFAEARAIQEMIQAFLAGNGTGGAPIAVPGGPSGGRPGGTWKAGDDLPDPLHRDSTERQDGSDKQSGAPWESSNLPETPGQTSGSMRQRFSGDDGSTPNPGFNDPSGQASSEHTSGPWSGEDGWKRADGDTNDHQTWNNSDGRTYTDDTTRRYDGDALVGYHRSEVTKNPGGTTERTDTYWDSRGGYDSRHNDPSHPIIIQAGSGGRRGRARDRDPDPDGGGRRPSGDGLAHVIAWFGGRMITCNIGGCVAGVSRSGRTTDPDRPDEGTGGSTGTGDTIQARTGPGAATDPDPEQVVSGGGGGGGAPRNPGSDSGSMGGPVGDTGDGTSVPIPGAPPPTR
jgi:hypothetical protein